MNIYLCNYIYICIHIYVNRSPKAEVKQQKYNNPLPEAAAASFVLCKLCISRGYLCKPQHSWCFWARGFSCRNNSTGICGIAEMLSRQEVTFVSVAPSRNGLFATRQTQQEISASWDCASRERQNALKIFLVRKISALFILWVF